MQKRIDLFQDMLHQMSQFLGYSFSKAQLAREFNISRETLYQYLRTDD